MAKSGLNDMQFFPMKRVFRPLSYWALISTMIAGHTYSSPESAFQTSISNMEQKKHFYGTDTFNGPLQLAQAFTVGAVGGHLHSIDVKLYRKDSDPNITASLWSTFDHGYPNERLYTLNAPSISNGTITFMAPANTALYPGNTYSIFLQSPSYRRIQNMESGEDLGGEEGWSIANYYLFRRSSDDLWSIQSVQNQSGWHIGGVTFKVEVNMLMAPLLSTSSRKGKLEVPAPNSNQSGIGVLSGWYCDASSITLEIDESGKMIEASYGTSRSDTKNICGDSNNGFGLLYNWNTLGDGLHKVVAYADGEEFSQATFEVTTLGQEFVQGVRAEYKLFGFPGEQDTVWLAWQESTQNFVIVDKDIK